MTTPKIYRAVLDADAAQKLLDMMVPENRKPAYTTVNRYARDMLDGKWINDGSPIKRRASDNKVFDGGNRLTALVQAAKTRPGIQIEFTIAENVPDEAFAVMDSNRPRTNRDIMVMASGGKSSGKAAGIVTWVWKYRRGNPFGVAGGRAVTPTRSEFVDEYLTDANGFETSSLRGQDTQRRRIAPHTVAGVFHYLMKTTDGIGEDWTEDFFGKFMSGANMDADHPILQLRNRLTARGFPRSMARVDTRTYSPGEQLYLFHRTWRAYVNDESVLISLPRVAVTNDTFPKLVIPATGPRDNASPVLKDSDPASEVG